MWLSSGVAVVAAFFEAAGAGAEVEAEAAGYWGGVEAG